MTVLECRSRFQALGQGHIEEMFNFLKGESQEIVSAINELEKGNFTIKSLFFLSLSLIKGEKLFRLDKF